MRYWIEWSNDPWRMLSVVVKDTPEALVTDKSRDNYGEQCARFRLNESRLAHSGKLYRSINAATPSPCHN
jgi:hypothetical protein